MAFQITYDCDLCGVSGGEGWTMRAARDDAKRRGWAIIRVANRERMVCPKCRDETGGNNECRRKLRRELVGDDAAEATP